MKSTLDDLDLDLEKAIADLRGYCSRLAHGRVILTVARHDGHTYGHELEVERLTTEDWERMMRELPRKQRP